MDCILGEFAICIKNGVTPDTEEPTNFVKKLQCYISEDYYTCTGEILCEIGQMYVADERFKNNIDKHAERTAPYI